jgi:hypothetical protein
MKVHGCNMVAEALQDEPGGSPHEDRPKPGLQPGSNAALQTTVYSVPRRFGLAAILAFTTLFGMVSGVLKYNEAPVAIYLFVGVLGATVCGAQMYLNSIPRFVSVLAGGFFLPLFLLVSAAVIGEGFWPVFIATPLLFLLGGFVGYLTGTISAGVFLAADLLERRWRGDEVIQAEVVQKKIPPQIPVYTPDSCQPYLGDAATAVLSSESPMSDPKPQPHSHVHVKPLGPPESIPVYNCIALVAPRGADGLVHVRAANVAGLRTSGQNEREALQHLVGAFKIIISQATAEGRPVPILDQPIAAAPDEQQRLIAVHL